MVRGNDWSSLEVPDLEAWKPSRTVSVVIPAHGPIRLPWVLAALAAQSYPAHLLEVVVADDGSDPPAVLPELRPERTRVIRVTQGWGRAAACQAGVDASDGEVLHWLDADMVVARHEVEAQLRWHHVVDYAVVLGDKLFTDADALAAVTPVELHDAVARGDTPWSLTSSGVAPHPWVEKILDETQGLSQAGPRAMRAHVGASASVGRDLYEASGGMPVELALGEDIVLGYRLREAGAVFIPDREARALHLGETTMMRNEAKANRYNKPFITDLVPEFRGHRLRVPRSYAVAYVEVVVPVGDASYEDVAMLVHAQLTCSVPDLVVSLIGPWAALGSGRRPVLAGDDMDLHLMRAAWRSEPRVRFVPEPAVPCDATFRLSLPGSAQFPAEQALEKLLRRMENQHVDRIDVTVDGGTAMALRSAAVARVGRARGDDSLRPALPTVSARLEASEAGFVGTADAPRVRQIRGLVPWGVGQ